MLIRRLKFEEIALLKEFAPPDWHFDLAEFIKMHFYEPYFIPLVAEISGNIAGVGNGISSGASGWIGNIIVKEEFRRQGIGTSITKEVIRQLKELKCRSFLLIATHDGIPVYRKLGFRQVANYSFYPLERQLVTKAHPCIRPVTKEEYDRLLQLDFEATAERRNSFLHQFLPGAMVFFDEKISGFYLPSLGHGYIMAKSVEAGTALLSYKISKTTGILVIPEQNFEAISYLEKLGYREKNIAPRMIYGTDISWNPAMIYSRAAGYCG